MIITNVDNGKSRIRFNYNVLRDPKLSKIVHTLKHSDKSYWYGKVYWNDPKIKLEQISESALVFEVGVNDFVEIISNDATQQFNSKIAEAYLKRLAPLKLILSEKDNNDSKDNNAKYTIIYHGDRYEGSLTDKIVDIMPKDTYWFIELDSNAESDFANCTITYYNAKDLTLKDIFTIDGKLSEKTEIKPFNLWVYDSAGDPIEGRYSLSDYGSGDTMYVSCNCNEDTLYTILEKDGYNPYELFAEGNHYINGINISISGDNAGETIPHNDKTIYNKTLNRPLGTFDHGDYIYFDINAM
jgi:hypothetical protein